MDPTRRTAVLARTLIGFAIALAVATLARRTRSLSVGGAVTATIIGTLAMAAGWNWGILLIVYFISSTALSHLGRASKEARTASVVAKGGERDAIQVFANGAMFAGAALAMIVRPNVRWIALGAGALAASAADTWATEVGTLARGEPRSILNWRRVPVGTSGGVSLEGTLAMVAGAVFIAALVVLLGWTADVAVRVGIGGIVGAVVDSLLGATLQARRWCDTCNRETERATHDCGAETRAVRGFGWLDNDIVNFLSGAVGGLLAGLLTQ
jgi:uncharacterized protein (TIGR00297 family)